MDRPEFQRLCDYCDVRGLSVRLGVSIDLHRSPRKDCYRKLTTIRIVSVDEPIHELPINGSIDEAASRAMQVLV